MSTLCECGCGQATVVAKRTNGATRKGEHNKYAIGHNRLSSIRARSLSEKFWPRVQKGDGCWIWTGRKNRWGHGKVGGAGFMAHRVAWELAYGQVPNGLFVCHRCDNPPCVRPEHLFLGTARDNTQDAIAKGRFVFNLRPETTRGEANGRAKITEDQVREIRKRRESGVGTGSLAKEYGLSRSFVQKIVRRERWSHVA